MQPAFSKAADFACRESLQDKLGTVVSNMLTTLLCNQLYCNLVVAHIKSRQKVRVLSQHFYLVFCFDDSGMTL